MIILESLIIVFRLILLFIASIRVLIRIKLGWIFLQLIRINLIFIRFLFHIEILKCNLCIISRLQWSKYLLLYLYMVIKPIIMMKTKKKQNKRENGKIVQNQIFKIKSWTIFLVLRRFNWRLSDYNESNFSMILFESDIIFRIFH